MSARASQLPLNEYKYSDAFALTPWRSLTRNVGRIIRRHQGTTSAASSDAWTWCKRTLRTYSFWPGVSHAIDDVSRNHYVRIRCMYWPPANIHNEHILITRASENFSVSSLCPSLRYVYQNVSIFDLRSHVILYSFVWSTKQFVSIFMFSLYGKKTHNLLNG